MFCTLLHRLKGYSHVCIFYMRLALFSPQLSNRAKKSIDEKQRLIEAMQSGVSPVGQKLFLHIRKT